MWHDDLLTAANAIVQLAVAPQMRGRVMALYMAVFMGGTPIGAPLLGWVAETFGARWTLVGGGVLTALGAVVATAVLAPRQGAEIRLRSVVPQARALTLGVR